MGIPYTPTGRYIPDPQDVSPMPFRSGEGADRMRMLADRSRYARGAAIGAYHGTERLSVDAGGSSTAFAVRVGPWSSCVLRDATGTWHALRQATEVVLTVADVEGAPGHLTNGTWYYVYAVDTGGAVGFVVSTVVPDAMLVYRSDDNQTPDAASLLHRYLGCFKTNGSGAPVPVRKHGRKYLYRASALDREALRVAHWTGVSSAGWEAEDLYPLVPPHVRLVSMEHEIYAGADSGAQVQLQVRTNGDTGTGVHSLVCQVAGERYAGWYDIDVDSARMLEANYHGTVSATNEGSLFVRGFEE